MILANLKVTGDNKNKPIIIAIIVAIKSNSRKLHSRNIKIDKPTVNP